jgi:cell division protein FtsL
MNIDIEFISVGLGVIVTLVGVGWKLSQYMNEIRISVAKIETILSTQSARLDRLETEVNDIKKELRWDHK